MNSKIRFFSSFVFILFLTVIIVVATTSVRNEPTHAQIPSPGLSKRDIGTLATQADLILIGSTLSVSSKFTTNELNDQLITSDVSIKPGEILKGQVPKDEFISLKGLEGGTVGSISMVSSIAPFFIQGQQVVLFLVTESGNHRVLGSEIGKFDVDDTGRVSDLEMTLEQFQIEILSYLSGGRLYLPMVAQHNNNPSASSPAMYQAAALSSPQFVPSGYTWPGNPATMNYFLNNPGFNDTAAGTVTAQNQAIFAGSHTWDDWQGRANFDFFYSGTTAINNVMNDGNNVVMVRDAASGSNPSALATAYRWSNTSTGNIIECDIVFWDQNYIFSPAGAASTYDIQSIATHEFGHCLGLKHSLISGSTMYPSVASGATYPRSLHLDEIDGITSLYNPRLIYDDQTLAGANEPGDLFGTTLATADFFSDSFDRQDLAVGAPGEDYAGSGSDAGVVFLFRSQGVSFDAPILLHQSPAGVNEAGDGFGAALATGDFNNDGLPDLAVGVPEEDIEGVAANTGVVYLFYGDGNGVDSPDILTQNPADANEVNDRFGSALIAGDFNGDGVDDLVTGAPGEDVAGSGPDAGMIFVFLGSASGLGTPVAFSQSGAEVNEAGDLFGNTLAAGDFDNDGFDDLAVGAPGENYAGSGPDAGVVFAFPGSVTGLGGPIVFDQSGTDSNEAGDQFGTSLAVGDFSGSGYDDLAVGAPGENYAGSGPDAGVVFVIYGSFIGLGNSALFDQGAVVANETGDRFGSTVATGDFNSDGYDELVIGAPGENYLSGATNAGVVQIRQLNDDSGSTIDYVKQLSQEPAGVNETGDGYGSALAVGRFTAGVDVQLVIGAPGESLDGSGSNTGAIFFWH